jgi:hypothetical protein
MLHAQDKALTISAADVQAASGATSLSISANPAVTDAGLNARRSDLVIHTLSATARESRNEHRGPSLFPADLSKFQANAPVVTTATLHNIYINQPATAWGNPAGFLNDLNRRKLIVISDVLFGV